MTFMTVIFILLILSGIGTIVTGVLLYNNDKKSKKKVNSLLNTYYLNINTDNSDNSNNDGNDGNNGNDGNGDNNDDFIYQIIRCLREEYIISKKKCSSRWQKKLKKIVIEIATENNFANIVNLLK